jgi:class 3 adenylate cyclase
VREHFVELEPRSRSFLVVDIEKSSDRTDPEKAELRDALYRVLLGALDTAGLTAERRRLDDLGDGVLAVVDSEVLPLLHPLVDEVVEGLRRYNATVDPPAWMRLRLGIHFGLAARDAHGWVGDDVTTTFRIVNGAGVKAALRAAPRAQSVVVVSDAVHRSVVRHRYREVRPENYHELLDDGRKVWVRVPGHSAPPAPVADALVPPRTEAPASKTISIKAKGNVFTADTITTVDARTRFGPRS